MAKETIVADQTFNFSYSSSEDLYEIQSAEIPKSFVAGAEHTVVWDGVEYKCVAKAFTTEGFPLIALGNMGLIYAGENTAEPFCVYSISFDYSALCIRTKEAGETHTVAVYMESIPKVGIFAPQTVDGFALTSYGFYGSSKHYALQLEEGQSYIVSWDGGEYLCTGMSGFDGEDHFVAIGNKGAIFQEVTTEPFAITYMPDSGANIFFSLNSQSSHKVSVCKVVQDGEALISEQEIYNFALDESMGIPIYKASGMISLIGEGFPAVGSKYKVLWDGNEYICTAYQTMIEGIDVIGLGNEKMLTQGVSEFVEPFAVLYAPSVGAVLFLALSSEASHTVGLYVYEPETEKPERVVLRDFNGNDNTYEGVTAVKLNLDDGNTQTFYKGVPKDIKLDFSAGDMEVAEENKVFSSVTIPKPDNLTPENIAEGVDIAGIIGTMAGGGGFKFTTGKITTAGAVQVMHGLDVVPDIIIVQMDGIYTGCLYYATWFSSKLCTAIGASKNPAMYAYVGSGTGKDFASGSTENEPAIRNVTYESFIVGSAASPAVNITSGITVGKSTWYAISFLN